MRIRILSTLIALAFSSAHSVQAKNQNSSLDPCANSPRDMRELTKGATAGILELRLENADGDWVGVLFASENQDHTLYGQGLYLCGNNDNNFYVNADSLQRWIGEDGDFVAISTIATHGPKNFDLIHHDEALMAASAETISQDDKEARIRVIFNSWNFATETGFSGTFYLNIPKVQN